MNLTKAEKEDLAARCWRSPVEFCRVFLPDWFPTKMPWVHRGILAILSGQTDFLLDFGPELWRDGEASWTVADLQKIMTNFVISSNPRDRQAPMVPIFRLDGEKLILHKSSRTAIVMPRGFGKTTIINAENLRQATYQALDFFLYLSEAGGHAERQLMTIRTELESNLLLREIFGDHVPSRQDSEKWTDSFIETRGHKVMIGAAGRGGQVRGFAKSAKRPKRIIGDDIEDSESVGSSAQIEKTMNWLKGTVEPALHRDQSFEGELVLIGTILKNDAMLPSLERDPEWTWIKFSAIDRQGEPLWAYKMSLGDLARTKQSFTAVGQLSAFYLEYMSEARSDESRIFPADKLTYVHKPIDLFEGVALMMDPAISSAAGADYCAYAVTGIEKTGHIHVIDTYLKKGMTPAEQVEKYFELHFRYCAGRPARHGVEAIAYQRALVSIILAEQYQKSQTFGNSSFFEVIPVTHGRQGKLERVQGVLQPRYWAGYISFESRDPLVEEQLIEWPNSKLDGPDAIAMSIALLDPMAQLNAGVDSPFNQTPKRVANFRHAP